METTVLLRKGMRSWLAATCTWPSMLSEIRHRSLIRFAFCSFEISHEPHRYFDSLKLGAPSADAVRPLSYFGNSHF
jgi:hypothetical protein